MRVILTILFVLFCGAAISQTRPSGFPAQKTTTWHQFGYVGGDSAILIARRDTLGFLPRFSGSLVMRPQDRRPYFYDSVAGRWFKFTFEGDIPVGTFFAQDGNTFADTGRLGTNDNFPLLFETNNTRRGIITENGQIGLGTLSPAAFLDVNGVSQFRDSLKVKNVIEVGDASINGIINLRRFSDGQTIGQIFPNGSEFHLTATAGTMQLMAGITPKLTVRTSGISIGSNSNASFASILEQAYLVLLPGDTATNRGAPLKFTLDGAKVLNTKQRGVMEAMSNYLMWTDSLLNRDTLGTRRWVRDNFAGGTGNLIARGGLTKRNDTIFLQGTLDSFQLIRTHARKNIPLGPGNPSTGLVIANQADSLEIPFLINGTTSDRSLLYLHKYYYPDDTVSTSYGGLLSGINRIYMDPTQNTYTNQSRPYVWTYSGFNIASQIRNPDTMWLQTSPYGHTGGSNMQIDVGPDAAAYRIDMFSQSNISSPYPISSYRSGLDLARVSSAGKRETYGPGYAGYIWDWRNHQLAINGGSTEYGSYVGRVTGFYAYGLLSTQNTSSSKAKTLAVSTADTVIGVRIAPMWGSLNEVKNGYGVVAEGTGDDNHFAGKLRVGGPLPLNGGQVSQFQVYDTVPTATFGPNSFVDGSANVGTYILQNGVTSANIGSKKTRGMYVWKETNYDGLVNLNSRFQLAFLGYNVHAADSAINMSAGGNGDISGSQFALALRKKTGWTDTTYFNGGVTGRNSPNALSVLLDMSGAPANVTRLNWFKGYWSALTPIVNFNSWQRADNISWITAGGGQSPGVNAQIDTGTIVRLLAHDSRVLTKYAIQQEGTGDTVLLNGPIRFPNLPIGGSSDSVLVKKANGLIATLAQSSISGAPPALTTNQIGVGIAGVLGGTSALTYDGTSVKQENALASYSGTSTTAGGSTSGFDYRGFLKATPTAADQVLARFSGGTLDGGTTENITARIEAVSNAAHTPGVSEPTRWDFYVTGTSTPIRTLQLLHNGRILLGGTATTTGNVNFPAGSTSVAQTVWTPGTFATTPVSGGLEYNGTSWGFTVGSTRKRAAMFTEATPPAGALLQGNATDFTLLALGTANQILHVNSGATALEYINPNYTLLYSDTSTTTVANTTTETTLLGNGVGSLSFAGTMLVPGSVITLKGSGNVSTAASAGTPTFTFTVGSVAVGVNFTGLTNSLTNANYEYEFEVYQFMTGNNKDCFYKLKVDIIDNGVIKRQASTGLLATTFSSTGTITCNVTGDWNTADPSNSIISHGNTVEVKLRQ